jgi:hypothetical protein
MNRNEDAAPLEPGRQMDKSGPGTLTVFQLISPRHPGQTSAKDPVDNRFDILEGLSPAVYYPAL